MEPSFSDSQLIPASKTRWQRIAQTLETGGWLFIAVLLVGALTIATCLELQQREMLRLQQATQKITLLDIGARLETDLGLGLDLDDNIKAQGLIEEALSVDPAIRTIDIFSAEGVTLFSTDRGTIGEPAAGALGQEINRQIARKSVQNIQLQSQEDITLAMPLRGSFGENAGYLAVSFASAKPTSWGSTLVLSAIMLIALSLAALVFNAWAIQPQLEVASSANGLAQDAAAARAALLDTRSRLDETWEMLQEELGAQSSDTIAQFTDSVQIKATGVQP